MKQTTLSRNRNSLLDCAFSKLNPEVFLHPVWLRFGKRQRSQPLDLILDLISAAQTLEKEDPSAACQTLLICAVYQRYAGRYDHALKSTLKARVLAENTGLTRETLWALWASSSISLGAGNYEQAARSLADLQAALIEQNEWILADFVEVVKQSIFQPAKLETAEPFRSTRDPPSADLLAFTFDWLQEWGFSDLPAQSEFQEVSSHPAGHAGTHSTLIQSFFSMQRWQGRWHTLRLALRGELRLHWASHSAPLEQKKVSVWVSILRSLQLKRSRQTMNSQVTQDIPEVSPVLPLPSGKGSTISKKAARNKPITVGTKVDRTPRPGPGAAAVPVAVHMLGALSLTIGDLTLKLPSSRGLSVLKYLFLHHNQKIPRDVLIDIFWPDADPETARNNLNVAIHSLRKALRRSIFLPVIVFESGTYGLENNLQIWLDVEEFERCVREGQRLEARNQLTAAIGEYETAISLYQGDLLEQNPYEEWTILERERLRIAYLDTLDRLSQIYLNQESYAVCISLCQRILMIDNCSENAHRRLMRCYYCQGQNYLALRQYQVCVEILRDELDTAPAPSTAELYEKIRCGQGSQGNLRT